MLSRRRMVLFGALALAAGTAGLIAGVYGWRYLTATVTVAGAAEAGCDLQRGPCRARFPGGGEMIVTLAPRPIPLVKPVKVDIQLHNLPVERVEVDVSSPDMHMGYNRRPLRALDAQRYTGYTVLPVCIRDRMRWELRAIAHHGKVAHEAAFVFETVTNRAELPG